MAYNFKGFNNSAERKFKYDESKHRDFITLSKLYEKNGADEVYTVLGGWINKRDKYGDRPEIVIDEHIIDAPRSSVETWNQIFTDDEAIKSINGGECKIKISKFHSDRYNKDIYTILFI